MVVAPRTAGEVCDLVGRARAAGAVALLIVDAEATEPYPLPDHLDYPVISVGKAVKYVFSNPHVHRRAATEATDITTASLTEVDDTELMRAGMFLTLCWLVPDVRWVL